MSGSDWGDGEWGDYPKAEDIRLPFGEGDGATTTFSGGIRGPIVPGSVRIRVMPPDAVSRLGALTGHIKPEMACCDIGEDGVMHGNCTGTVNYTTGYVQIIWEHAPADGADIVLTYKRRLHRLYKAKMRVKLGGKKRWVTLRELREALNNLY